jgi:hypothetical protein
MAELFSSLNWLSITGAALLYFFLGALWYSPLLFANTWMELRNLTEAEIDKPNPVIFLYSFILQFIAVVSLALFIKAMNIEIGLHGLIVGFGAGAGLVFTLAGTTGIFSDVKMKLHFIDNGYHVAGLSISGMILGMW